MLNRLGAISLAACALSAAAGGISDSVWLSVPGAKVAGSAEKKMQSAADGTSWFVATPRNEKKVTRAVWRVAGLGVFDIYVNGVRVGEDFLKPGYTHAKKTKAVFTYDVTRLMKTGAGETNALAAEVGAGWWRDQIVRFVGVKSAFRGCLTVTYDDGSETRFGTNPKDWTCGVAGPILHSGIFDGETYDAREQAPFAGSVRFGTPEENKEFAGELVDTLGANVTLRRDLTLKPVEAYCWKDIADANGPWKGPSNRNCASERNQVYGHVVRTRTFKPGEPMRLVPGETLILDFGQNAAAIPSFAFRAAAGTVLTALPGEMLNDSNGERSRGNDGPAGSIYRENLRRSEWGMRVVYTFAGGATETYEPRFTFFGYRYLSVTATGPVEIDRLVSVPVTSVAKADETGTLETGRADINRLIANVYWGQLSNYLSVPTDCPQRNERLGWTADTQAFVEAGSFNADTRSFFRKWLRDLVDTQGEKGGFPGTAPYAQYGNETTMRVGWADAGIIVPYQLWKQFGLRAFIDEMWAPMEKFMARVEETKYEQTAIAAECQSYQWADWLSYEKLESNGGGSHEIGPDGKSRPKADALRYWDYLCAAYWIWDARMMAEMAAATERDAAKYTAMAARAKERMLRLFFSSPDGMIDPVFRDMQTPALFALKLGLVEGTAREKTIAALKANFAAHGGCLQTGFLGTSILMDTLTENGMVDIAYSLLFQRKNPSWLYSVDQGATTIWERWNSYRKDTGFGPVGMNSFNHYAYGAVLAWMYKTMAGIAADPTAPGFARIVMRPVPDRRLGFVKARYRSAAGVVTSAWRYEGAKWIWEFTVPAGATARVTVPGETAEATYPAGTHRIVRELK